jgi:hypothetical protein
MRSKALLQKHFAIDYEAVVINRGRDASFMTGRNNNEK